MSINSIIRNQMLKHRDSMLKSWDNSVPQVFKQNTLESCLSEDMSGRISRYSSDEIKRFAKEPKKSLILQGSSGLGKTAISYALCREMIRTLKANSAVVIDYPTLTSNLSFRKDYNTNPIEEYLKPDVLVLDDLGAGGTYMTSTQEKGVWAIINRRWSEGKTTIITTNLPLDAYEGMDMNTVTLRDWLGESAWDRILDDCLVVEFSGKSLRGASGKIAENRRRMRARRNAHISPD